MEPGILDEATALLEKANANLEPELLSAEAARELLAAYARAEKLASYGRARLAGRIDDATEVARVTGTSVGRARDAIDTGKSLGEADEVAGALRIGDLSLDQASEIAGAERACPGAGAELVEVARDEAFHVLRDRARRIRLEAEQHRDLGARQRAARGARSHGDELGMVHVHLALEPHVGTPIVARAEAEAARRYRKARQQGRGEPFERVLADAYAALLQGSGKGRARRPELVVLVSHEVTQRGWTDVKEGETCKIPGVGPVPPAVAREIAQDAFLSGVFFDGVDLRQFRRWTRNTPVEVRIALELGPPPHFDGVTCVDCGNRFRTEFDHLEPHVAGGPASNANLDPRCWSCHREKTRRDRRAGKLTPPPPGGGRGPP
ncbi:MAG: HNH endonuclease signature motif containing protein [Actinomycetota bacterium]